MSLTNRSETPIYKQRIPSLHIVRKHFLILLVVFAVSQLPVYFLSLLLGKSTTVMAAIQSAVTNADAGETVSGTVLLALNELAFIFKLICCSFIAERAVFGKDASVAATLQKGMGKLGRIYFLLLPILLIEILFITIIPVMKNTLALIVIFLFLIIFLLKIFEFLLIPAASLRDLPDWKLYRNTWNLSKGNWWRILSVYIESNIIIMVFACPLYIPMILLLNQINEIASPYVGIIADVLYMWVIIEMVLLYLDLERKKSAESNPIIEPKEDPFAIQK
jgi:hypothetical protein